MYPRVFSKIINDVPGFTSGTSLKKLDLIKKSVVMIIAPDS